MLRTLKVAIPIVIALAAAVSATAAPSIPVTKPPVSPIPSWTGPTIDPDANQGQWFQQRFTGAEEPRTHEFHDNVQSHGGGFRGPLAIQGVVASVTFVGVNIQSFVVDATITNDTPGLGVWASGTNSHNEYSQLTVEAYEGTFKNVKLSCSFARDPQVPPPTAWVLPYINRNPQIYSNDHEQLAWYCWTPNNPVGKTPYGSYCVPTFDFGNIAPGQKVMRPLLFSTSGSGISPSDPRYSVIMNSYQEHTDIFLNRTISLKISDWMDLLYTDTGVPYPDDTSRGSDVSVFHDLYSEPRQIDWGDCPDSYSTLSGSGGPNHLLTPNLFLGANIDAELDGQPDPVASLDDNTGVPDDEDGVVFNTAIVPGTTMQITVTASAPGSLSAWIDWNADSSFAQAADKVLSDYAVLAGPNVISIPVPAGTAFGATFARFRLSSQVGLSYGGAASDGEVEDYMVNIDYPTDYGDAPDQPYPTLRLSGGAGHTIAIQFCLGNNLDVELDGQPTAAADGDDISPSAGPDDEDGVQFVTPLLPGSNATVNVTVTAASGMSAFIDAWIDFNGDGSWATPGDQIFATQPVVNGPNTLTFAVPASATPGAQAYARFRLSNTGGLSFGGTVFGGEVEDYRVGIGYKWIQKPDLSTEGIDINASEPFILADDFLCTTTGPITDIHLWGSWKFDEMPQMDPHNVWFRLSIHEDIPAGTGGVPYSRPGNVLWMREFTPGSFGAIPYAMQILEGWMNPPQDYIFPGDYTCWQYDFLIEDGQFYQRGTEEEPIIYWLDVQAMPMDQAFQFGWKTSVEHWNDDAVWGIGVEPYTGPWNELVYPPMHEFAGKSIDLAFAITGKASERDWGDAPDRPYPTKSATGGASHAIIPGVFLGNTIDAETDGQPDPMAMGDDINPLFGIDDEDGVTFLTPLVSGQMATISVVASTSGFLDLWIDYNINGTWADPLEQVYFALPIGPGPNTLQFLVPPGLLPGQTFARFRFHTSPTPLPFTGPAADGEVEDYVVDIHPQPPTLTFYQNVAIKDHFWWPGFVRRDNEMLSLKVVAGPPENTFWNSLTVAASGSGNDAFDIVSVDVWLDNDSDGVVDLGGATPDTLLGSGVYPVDNGSVNIAFAAPPLIPAGGSVAAIVSYQMSPAAPAGSTYYATASNATGSGQVTGAAASIFSLPITGCKKVVGVAPISIGAAKRVPVGTLVLLESKEITADFLWLPTVPPWNWFYIEEPDMIAGIGVIGGITGPLTIGDGISILGRTTLVNPAPFDKAELMLNPVHILTWSKPRRVTPMGMNNLYSGAGDFSNQPPVFDDQPNGVLAAGLSNVGMLIKTWGMITGYGGVYLGPGPTNWVDVFWLDDGSDLADGYPTTLGPLSEGIAVVTPRDWPNPTPPSGFYDVTGILRAIQDPTGAPAVRLIVPRATTDLKSH